MTYDARNPKRNALGTIDVEVNHQVYGWIPFTASPHDVEAHGRDLFERAEAGEFGPVLPFEDPAK